MKGTIRKIIVGDNYTYNIKYVKGSIYKVGVRKCEIVEILINADETEIDLYVNDGNSTFIWKTINAKPLEVEYDVNFK
jgi:hypothetical protein